MPDYELFTVYQDGEPLRQVAVTVERVEDREGVRYLLAHEGAPSAATGQEVHQGASGEGELHLQIVHVEDPGEGAGVPVTTYTCVSEF